MPVLPARVPPSRLGRGGGRAGVYRLRHLRDRLCLRRAGAAAVGGVHPQCAGRPAGLGPGAGRHGGGVLLPLCQFPPRRHRQRAFAGHPQRGPCDRAADGRVHPVSGSLAAGAGLRHHQQGRHALALCAGAAGCSGAAVCCSQGKGQRQVPGRPGPAGPGAVGCPGGAAGGR